MKCSAFEEEYWLFWKKYWKTYLSALKLTSEIVLDMLQNMSEEFLLEKNVIRLCNCKMEKFAYVSKK